MRERANQLVEHATKPDTIAELTRLSMVGPVLGVTDGTQMSALRTDD